MGRLSIRLSDEDLKTFPVWAGLISPRTPGLHSGWECQCCLLLKRRYSRTLIWWVNYQEGAKVVDYDFAPDSRSMHNLEMVMGSSQAGITLDLKACSQCTLGNRFSRQPSTRLRATEGTTTGSQKSSSWTWRSWL